MRVIRKIFNPRPSKNGFLFLQVRNILGFPPGNLEFYKRAFIHPSLQKKDEEGNSLNYERLEFLGDAILGAVVAAHLFQQMPESNEGSLTQFRSKIVNRQTLNKLGRELGLIKLLEKNGFQGELGTDIHGNLFEAFIGALYMDKGYQSCEDFIRKKVIEDYVDMENLENKIISYKSCLIEWCQKEKKNFSFVDCEDSGKEPRKHFSVKLFISGKAISKARSTSKKKAEEKAARRAYFVLQDKIKV